MAQAIRAILLASAIAATRVSFRANNAASQGRCLVPSILKAPAEKREAEEDWAAHLNVAIDRTSGANVTALRGKNR
jgi:hypothetical protein